MATRPPAFQVLAHRVGPRPTCRAVRVEPDRLPGCRPITHGYGHTDAGAALS